MVAGERAPRVLTALRHYRCQQAEEAIARALTGTGRAEHLRGLTQALACVDCYMA
jgi:hypothetical protein